MRNNKKNAFENILMKIGYEFKNKVYSIVESDQKYASNFGKQWKDFSKTQIDEYNGTNISKNLSLGDLFLFRRPFGEKWLRYCVHIYTMNRFSYNSKLFKLSSLFYSIKVKYF